MTSAAADDLQSRLDELDRQRQAGEISEITYNVRRNLLMTRSMQSARRRAIAMVIAPPPLPPLPVLEERRRRRFRIGIAGFLAAAALISCGAVLAYSRLAPSGAAAATTPATSPPRLPSRAAAPATHAVLPTSRPPGGPGSRSTQPSDASSPIASLPSVAGSQIGGTQTLPGGGTVAIIAYTDHFTPTSLINNPLPQGGFYAAIDVRVCAGASASTTVSPFDFVLVEPDGTIDTIATGPSVGRQPVLGLATLQPGMCTAGWLSYGLSVAPTSVTDQAAGLTWSLA